MNLYYSILQHTFTDYRGIPTIPELSITFGEHEDIRIAFDTEISSLKWTFTAIHNKTTILYTSDDDISKQGNSLTIPVNAYTKEFQAAIAKGDTSAVIELFAVDASNRIQHIINATFIARASSVSGATPPEIVLPPTSNFITPEQLEEHTAQARQALDRTKSYVTIQHLNEVLDVSTPIQFITNNEICYHELAENDVIQFDFSKFDDTAIVTVELWLKMPDPAVSFSIPGIDEWLEEPDFTEAGKLYCITIRKSKFHTIANIAYTQE